jgi:UDP-glucose 4-epimerase
VARIISQSGTKVQVLDNYSTGLDSRVLGLPTTNFELSDPEATATLEWLMRAHKVTAVVHLAALKEGREIC